MTEIEELRQDVRTLATRLNTGLAGTAIRLDKIEEALTPPRPEDETEGEPAIQLPCVWRVDWVAPTGEPGECRRKHCLFDNELDARDFYEERPTPRAFSYCEGEDEGFVLDVLEREDPHNLKGQG